MGTRSVMRVEGANFVEIYKHYDGYPSAQMPWLTKFNQDFAKNRGDDPEYKLAQLLRYSGLFPYAMPGGDNRYTGWGVMPYGSCGDNDYIYLLKTDGTVEAYTKNGTTPLKFAKDFEEIEEL